MIHSVHLLLVLIGNLIVFNALGQQKRYAKPLFPDLPFSDVVIDETTPEWAKMLYGERPNIKEVRQLADIWALENPGIKTDHTRNLKHYLRHLVEADAINPEGYVQYPDDYETRDLYWSKKRQKHLVSKQSVSTNTWVSVGPHIVPETQGRVNAQANVYAIDQSKSHPNILYAGSETSYVYKSIDKGLSWNCVSNDIVMGGPMEIEIHPSNPDIVYVGTAHEIYKTLDGGLTWNSVRYDWSQDISTIIIHPANPDIVIAGGDEGMIRSTDGGQSWTSITTTRVYDLKFKTDDPTVVFALWHNAAELVTDFYRSSNSGVTWTRISNGWDEPNTSTGNSGGRMTVSDDYPNVMYTFTGAAYTHLSDPKNGIKIRKSSDGGLSWQLMVDSDQVFKRAGSSSTTKINRGQGYYDWDIEMLDADTNIVMLGTQSKWLTHNGFANDTLAAWGDVVGGHADLQEALFNGDDLWIASDGGIVKANPNLINYEIRMQGFDATEFWSFDQGWNRDAMVGTMYHNGTMGFTDTYSPGQFRFFGGAEPEFSALKHPYPDKIISKGYGSVNGRSMPDNFADPETSFSYNLQPNSNYAIWLTNEESEIEVCPYNYNIHWAGQSNLLMKSTDFGVNWDVAFKGRQDGKITKIEIPRSNPDIMYVGEYHSTGYAIYKSFDGGKSFAALTNLPTLPGSDDDGVYLSVDHTDEDILFIAFHENDNDNDKVWKSTDGGLSWTNINTGSDLLDGEYITDLLAISGTAGDVYVTTRNAVYHRTNTQGWQMLINGLPAYLNIRHIKPFYKEGEIRIATMARGVYSMDMINSPSQIAIQPTVNNQEGLCNRDTFYFDDYSTINHDDASWSWIFDPSPAYVSNTNVRNPKVVFGSGIDTCKVYLTIQKGSNTYTDSMDYPIVIESQCDPDDHSGYCYRMNEYGDHSTSYFQAPLLQEWTVSFWIKPQVQSQATATIFDIKDAAGNRQFCANYFGSSGNLTMHYQGAGSNAWNVNPGMNVTVDQWNHIAYTSSVATGDVTIYINGEAFVYPNVSAMPTSFYHMLIGWQDQWWGGRYYQGEIDELAIYDRVLSQDEIRLRMHITKDLSTDPGILHYYQWNTEDQTTALDKINIRHLSLPADKVPSSGPFADGSSSKMIISNGGLKQFLSEGLTMTFANAGTYPNGEVVVTRLDTLPDTSPSDDEGSASYWVVHNFGSNQVFTALENITFTGYGTLSPTEGTHPSEFELYTRNFGQHSATWGTYIDQADQIIPQPTNAITFDPTTISSFGQFYITKGDCIVNPVVSSTLDSGANSLRAAIFDACPGDTITFKNSIDQSSINLSSTVIDIDKELYVLGNGITNTFIDGGNSVQLFRILDSKTRFGLEGLTLRHANAAIEGGALLNYGHTTIKQCLLSGNTQGSIGKGFTNYGLLMIKNGTTEIEE